MCLDGSSPGYYIGKGSGSGASKWILHQEGGGWCDTLDDCLNRSRTYLGSSHYWNSSILLGGIFSDDQTVNGEFYNWNVVLLGYCDGGSFAGYRSVFYFIFKSTYLVGLLSGKNQLWWRELDYTSGH